MRELTASEASRNFSALLDAIEAGETIIVTRGGKRVATMRPTEASTENPFADVLRRWNGRGYDDDTMERAVAEMRTLVSAEHDSDPWAE